ncbi:L-aminopeptidase/D-esterase [Luteitalea pratensis]|uniref:L-aminopeptidase/D-esterase n=1 Tax=Luteitalea pratensis TaxID=1855912 RepID=A0A143PN52_LUTPR|nr:P1 family peptidase [Luteitalea pratensis]AMY09856.1 L-aminopeptidase/D-esterase [Luteitalea pratensis]
MRASPVAQQEGSAGSLTDVPGVRVGHATDTRRPTGCTAILFDQAVTAGADYDGSAPGEMLGVMLQPVSPLERIHGILLTGGGPMGLEAVSGAVRYLEATQVGYDWGVPNVRIPIVVGAVIDDLSLGDGRIRPDADLARRACEAATTAPVAEGSFGVGAGATVGKMFRSRGMGGMKGGLGTVAMRSGDVIVAALSVVNCAGDVLDWRTGRIVAGARQRDGRTFVNSAAQLRRDLDTSTPRADRRLDDQPFRATTLTIIATNVTLDKTSLTKLAMMTNTGAARAINPYHTNGDGDQVLTISTSRITPNVSLTALGAVAADAASQAILRGVEQAIGLDTWPAVRDLR